MEFLGPAPPLNPPLAVANGLNDEQEMYVVRVQVWPLGVRSMCLAHFKKVPIPTLT